jgi:hypothetical protein
MKNIGAYSEISVFSEYSVLRIFLFVYMVQNMRHGKNLISLIMSNNFCIPLSRLEILSIDIILYVSPIR